MKMAIVIAESSPHYHFILELTTMFIEILKASPNNNHSIIAFPFIFKMMVFLCLILKLIFFLRYPKRTHNNLYNFTRFIKS